MNHQHNLIFFVVSLLASSCMIRPVADAALKSRVDNASPMGLYQVLEGAKIVAFSKDFLIKGGLEQKDLTSWENVTGAANDLVAAAISQGTAPAQYQQNINAIGQAAQFFKASVHTLHEAYGQLGFKKVKDKVVVNVGNTQFPPAALEDLKGIVQKSASYQNDMSAILKDILKSMVSPRSWAEKYYTKSGDLKDAKDIMKNYTDVIKSYNKNKLNKEPFAQFLNSQKIKDDKAAQKFVDSLQGIEYIMGAKLLVEEKEDRRKNLVAVQEIIEKTRAMYPEFLSVQEIAKLGEADKVTTIVFAQAGAYEAVLGQLNRETRALVLAAENKMKANKN